MEPQIKLKETPLAGILRRGGLEILTMEEYTARTSEQQMDYDVQRRRILTADRTEQPERYAKRLADDTINPLSAPAAFLDYVAAHPEEATQQRVSLYTFEVGQYVWLIGAEQISRQASSGIRDLEMLYGPKIHGPIEDFHF